MTNLEDLTHPVEAASALPIVLSRMNLGDLIHPAKATNVLLTEPSRKTLEILIHLELGL